MVFNGWLVLTSRPGLSCSPAHTRSHVKPKRTQTSTHWLIYTHTHKHTLSPLSLSLSLCILPLEDSGSCLCYWTGYHITAGTPPGSERKSPPALSRREIKAKGVRGKTRAGGRWDKNMLKCCCTALISIIRLLCLLCVNIGKPHNLIFQSSFVCRQEEIIDAFITLELVLAATWLWRSYCSRD